ncbi:hypothetical protein GIB67_010450 [Kingdonia uniflora]|uniref:RING-type E3 ubiquitin transferase n=1 Tax=Kingdonia uniflora TaxID=39325 RepID=A0A7J7MAE9_9MAGN|nr:hypothetical protein GIB67_010450 [Kingdonia uniflora]
MEMSRKFLIIFLLILHYTPLEASQDECSRVSRCKHHAPAVRFPFKLKGHHPDHCGYPGFELYCTTEKETMVKLPSSGDFIVKSINYKSQFMDIADPDNCIPRRLLQHLNFSESPFHQFKINIMDEYGPVVVHLEEFNLTFFNCSPGYRYTTQLISTSYKLSCLGAPGYEVRAIYAGEIIAGLGEALRLTSCRKIQTIKHVLMRGSDDHQYEFFLRFSWSLPICRSCEELGMRCRLKNWTIPPITECFNTTNKPDLLAKGM